MSISQAGFTDCIKNANPVFADTTSFAIGTGSAAIDAGDPAVTGTILYDILGNPRITGANPDLGAYEKQ